MVAVLSNNQQVLTKSNDALYRQAREVLIEAQPVPPPVITPELKLAFRQAAKLMHPDRATNESERLRRTELMRVWRFAL